MLIDVELNPDYERRALKNVREHLIGDQRRLYRLKDLWFFSRIMLMADEHTLRHESLHLARGLMEEGLLSRVGNEIDRLAITHKLRALRKLRNPI